MEIALRYSTVLELRRDLIPPVLEFFAGSSGIHSSEARVQLRAWYLFSRLLGRIHKHLASMSEQIISSFLHLLEIRLKPSVPLLVGDSDSDSDSEQDVFFESQLYLFQCAGLLVASTQSNDLEVGHALLRSLCGNIDEPLTVAMPDHSAILRVHHSIMAIGEIAKGYDSAGEMTVSARQDATIRLFTGPTETILEGLERLEESLLIRDAVISRIHVF
jgi:exportin-T